MGTNTDFNYAGTSNECDMRFDAITMHLIITYCLSPKFEQPFHVSIDIVDFYDDCLFWPFFLSWRVEPCAFAS